MVYAVLIKVCRSLFLCVCVFVQEFGPTLCGDENSDPHLMAYLGATLQDSGGNPL